MGRAVQLSATVAPSAHHAAFKDWQRAFGSETLNASSCDAPFSDASEQARWARGIWTCGASPCSALPRGVTP